MTRAEPTFVELCAGSAAVSMKLLGTRAPCRYMGGKGRLAEKVLVSMEMVAAHKVVLVDPGPWGRAWQALCFDLDAVCAAFDIMAAGDAANVYAALKVKPVPDDLVEFAAAFLVLQQLNWRSKPVMIRGSKWVLAGLDSTMAYGLPGTDKFGEVRPQLPVVAGILRTLDLSRVEAHQCRAEEVPPIPGATVYIDPPYQDTQGYADDLSRADVMALVERWSSVGARVGVSEAVPLDGMRSIKVGQQGKTAGLHSGARREEWLSLSFPASQMVLL